VSIGVYSALGWAMMLTARTAPRVATVVVRAVALTAVALIG
jgi:hypothetical protein